MSVLCLNVRRLCVPIIMIMSLGICFKQIAPRQAWYVCLIQHQNLHYFLCPIWKTKSW